MTVMDTAPPGVDADTRAVRAAESHLSPFVELDRPTWARLADQLDQPFDQADVERLRGLGETLSLREVAEVYLPLSRLLGIHVEASGALRRATNDFLGERTGRTPYVIGVAGFALPGNYVDIIGFAVFEVDQITSNDILGHAVSGVHADPNDPALRRAQRARLVPWS